MGTLDRMGDGTVSKEQADMQNGKGHNMAHIQCFGGGSSTLMFYPRKLIGRSQICRSLNATTIAAFVLVGLTFPPRSSDH